MAKKEDRIVSGIYNVIMPLLEQKGLQVAKIVLFGSYAKQCEDIDSDIDLIIVSQNFRNKSIFERVKLTTGIGRKLVKTFKKPFDLMFYSDLEWDHSRSVVIDAARNEGKELQRVV
jgi:predicted nucleotidyltransferase